MVIGPQVIVTFACNERVAFAWSHNAPTSADLSNVNFNVLVSLYVKRYEFKHLIK